jgi:hypothetical protein
MKSLASISAFSEDSCAVRAKSSIESWVNPSQFASNFIELPPSDFFWDSDPASLRRTRVPDVALWPECNARCLMRTNMGCISWSSPSALPDDVEEFPSCPIETPFFGRRIGRDPGSVTCFLRRSSRACSDPLLELARELWDHSVSRQWHGIHNDAARAPYLARLTAVTAYP